MKFTVKLLALALLCSAALTACSGSGTESGASPSGGAAETVISETEAATETETQYLYSRTLADGLDYDGYNFRVLTWSGGNTSGETWNAFIDVAEETGEVLNDAAYARNREVEEQLNIEISCIATGRYNGTINVLQQSVMSAEDEYDFTVFHPSAGQMRGIIQDGCLFDIYKLDYVDLEQRYYNQNCAKTFTINGKLYLLSGDYSATMSGGTQIFFNADLWEDHSLEDPYELVRAGKWTFDKFISLAKDTYADYNGSGTADEGDFYGITGMPGTLAYSFRSCGGESVRLTDNGAEFPIASEHSVAILEKLVSAMSSPDAYFGYNSSEKYMTAFREGRSIMFCSGSSITTARNYDFHVGLLPFPKFDEKQETYPSVFAGGITAVPVTISDIPRTGAVIEALFSASSREFIDAYYQQYVEGKVLQDEDSLEMYKLIRAGATYDFTNYLDPTNGKLSGDNLITVCLNAKSTNIASEWAKIKDSVEASFAEMFEEIK